jgi:hypothetical protein
MKVKATIYQFDPSQRRTRTIGEPIINASNNKNPLILIRALTVFGFLHSPMNPSSNLRSKKRFGRKPAGQKKVKTTAATAKPKTKANRKAKAKAITKATDDQNGFSAIVRISVGNDLPIQLDHRVLDFNGTVARAGSDQFNGNPNSDIDDEISCLNLDEDSDDGYEPLIIRVPGTHQDAMSSPFFNVGVLSRDVDDADIIDERLMQEAMSFIHTNPNPRFDGMTDAEYEKQGSETFNTSKYEVSKEKEVSKFYSYLKQHKEHSILARFVKNKDHVAGRDALPPYITVFVATCRGVPDASKYNTYNQAFLCYLHHNKMSDGKTDKSKAHGDKYQPNTQGNKVRMLVAHFKKLDINYGLDDFKGGKYFYVF